MTEVAYVSGLSTYIAEHKDLIFNGAPTPQYARTNNISVDVLGHPTDFVTKYNGNEALVEAKISYTADGQILSNNRKISHAGNFLNVEESFAFDNVMRFVGHSISAGDVGNDISSLQYDSQDRLIVKSIGKIPDGGECPPNSYLQQMDYAYDRIGRIVAINALKDYECPPIGQGKICELTLDFKVSHKQIKSGQCISLLAVVVNDQSFPVLVPTSGPADLAQVIVSSLQSALQSLGLLGTVTQQNTLTPEGFHFSITISNTNASSVRLVFDNCDGIDTRFQVGECCDSSEGGGGGGFGGGGGPGAQNPSCNSDLYYQRMKYDGLDISQIEIGSKCYYGRMINDYQYDPLHRLIQMDNVFFNPNPQGDAFSTRYTYDKAGNILTLDRNGFTGAFDGQGLPVFGEIDKLAYTYQPGSSKLEQVADAVSDAAAQPHGFSRPLAGYGYDLAGNMTGAGDNGFSYNPLAPHLPQNRSRW